VAKRLSRRVLAEYFVRSLQDGLSEEGLVAQLAGYLVATRRTKESTLIIRDIEMLLGDHGMVVGTITSAFALDTATKQAIEAHIKSETNATRVALAEHTDPSVIGGYRINIPGKALDRTIATQLTTLKTHARKV
jgi:F0F1-type ATP synthase delta subunit